MGCKEVKGKKRANTIISEKLKEKRESKHGPMCQLEQSPSASPYPV